MSERSDLLAGCTDDKAVVEWMVHTHKVSVIPGTGCGVPGHIRVAFGKPAPADFREAADRLHAAMQELSEKGFSVVKSWQQQKIGSSLHGSESGRRCPTGPELAQRDWLLFLVHNQGL